MDCEPGENQPPAPSERYRGPRGLGETVARVLGEREEAGESLGAVEEGAFLKGWFAANCGFLSAGEWDTLELVANTTAEHEVRYRAADQRAVKRTYPGTFGNVPRWICNQWVPSPATPSEYLLRLALQNELFSDGIRLEGAMISEGPSMVLGQPPDGISLVMSQPWLEAEVESEPHPAEFEISIVLQERGFTPMLGSFYGWRHVDDGIVVLDCKPDNFIRTPEGILPIDLLIAIVDD